MEQRELEKARGSTDAVSAAARRRELHKHVAQEASFTNSQVGHGSKSAGPVAAAPRPAEIRPTLAGLAASAKARGQSVGARMDFRHLTAAGSSSTAGTSAGQAAGEHAAPRTGTVPPLPPDHAATVAKQSAAAIAKSLATSHNRAAFGRPLGGFGGFGGLHGGRGLGGGVGPRSAKPAAKNDELRKLKQLGGKQSPNPRPESCLIPSR
jgi:hypothetical protein